MPNIMSGKGLIVLLFDLAPIVRHPKNLLNFIVLLFEQRYCRKRSYFYNGMVKLEISPSA